MIINSKKLIGLKVETESNNYLGKISDIELDVFNHQIINYEIKTHEIIANIFGKRLLINPKQVVNINNDKMIVKDNINKNKVFMTDKNIPSFKKTTPLVNSQN